MSETKTFYVLPDTISVDDLRDPESLAARFAPVKAEWWCVEGDPAMCRPPKKPLVGHEGCHWAIVETSELEVDDE